MPRKTDPYTYRSAMECLTDSLQTKTPGNWAAESAANRHAWLISVSRELSLRYGDDGVSDVAGTALEDAASIAFSTYRAAGEVSERPAHTALNSLGLLTIAGPGTNDQARFIYEISHRVNGIRCFLPGILEVDPTIPSAVFEPTTAKRLAVLSDQPGVGCPAMGKTMEDFYQRYVQRIFEPELAFENLQAPAVA